MGQFPQPRLTYVGGSTRCANNQPGRWGLQEKVQHVDSIKRCPTYHQVLDPATVNDVPSSEQIVRDVERSLSPWLRSKRPREELCNALGIGEVLGDSARTREANKVALIQGIREDWRSTGWMTDGFILMYGVNWRSRLKVQWRSTKIDLVLCSGYQSWRLQAWIQRKFEEIIKIYL